MPPILFSSWTSGIQVHTASRFRFNHAHPTKTSRWGPGPSATGPPELGTSPCSLPETQKDTDQGGTGGRGLLNVMQLFWGGDKDPRYPHKNKNDRGGAITVVANPSSSARRCGAFVEVVLCMTSVSNMLPKKKLLYMQFISTLTSYK